MTNMSKIERRNQGSQIQHIIQTKVMQSGTFFRYIYSPCWRACHSTRILSLVLSGLKWLNLNFALGFCASFFQVLEAAPWCVYWICLHIFKWSYILYMMPHDCQARISAETWHFVWYFWGGNRMQNHMATWLEEIGLWVCAVVHLKGTRSSCGRAQMTRPTLWSTKSSRQGAWPIVVWEQNGCIERHFR